MSRAEDFLNAYNDRHDSFDDDTAELLAAIAEAWIKADAGMPSEQEANRWSPVCTAAEKVVGIE